MIIKIDLARLFSDSDSDEARRKRMHLTKLLACHNDIVANAKAFTRTEQTTNETTDSEYIARFEQLYFVRVICGHMHEALEGFEKCRSSGMIQKYRPLVKDGEQPYSRLCHATTDTRLLAFLKENRNRTFHYSFDGTLSSESLIVFGEDQTAQHTRYLFPEEHIKTCIRIACNLSEDDELELHKQSTALRSDFLRFVDRFVATIYERDRDAFSRND